MKILFLAFLVFVLSATGALADPLPSWNPGAAKQRIVAFVDRVTDPQSSHFVPADERVAVFDNDGTLWSEQPVYFQLMFALDRLREMAQADPSILKSDVLKAANAGDMKALMAAGTKGLLEVVTATHSGLAVDEFNKEVRAWLKTAQHPTKKRGYDTLIYQPMLELMRYLRDEGFKTYIVSGGGVHFMRAFVERAYKIPPEQVIGSAGKSSYQVRDGVPVIMKDPGIAFIDDKEGKPVAIDSKLGRRPIFAAGNSDGDFQMLEWTTAGDGPRFAMIIHHTDAEREWAYDRESHVGKLDRGLEEAGQRGWQLVDMKRDWSVVYPRLP
ncbi:MAG TPA: HAD family hydrolase [Alphaproteobacteria bacterium]|nr:HAD family hydrolase [Alphaproteobacteria bacterium]